MPSPNITFYKENKIANNHAMELGVPINGVYTQLQKSNYRALAQKRAMEVLNSYNPFGNGSCPNFNFVIPNGSYMGQTLEYNYGNAEVYFNGTTFNSLGGKDKATVYFWLPNFVRAGMLAYDAFYNI